MNSVCLITKSPIFINPFLAIVRILYALKTTEKLWLFRVFRGYEMGTLTRNGLKEIPLENLQNIFGLLITNCLEKVLT